MMSLEAIRKRANIALCFSGDIDAITTCGDEIDDWNQASKDRDELLKLIAKLEDALRECIEHCKYIGTCEHVARTATDALQQGKGLVTRGLSGTP